MNVIDHLKRIPLFSNLRPEQLDALAGQFKSEYYYAAREIIAQGSLAKRFMIIDQGLVNLRKTDRNGMEKSVGVVSATSVDAVNQTPLNYFGELMFTSQEPFDYYIHAVTDTVIYALERGDFDALVLKDPHLLGAMPFIEETERKRTRGFDWVGEGEAVATVIHKHWWVVLPALGITAIGALIAVGVSLLIDYFKVGFLGFAPMALGILVVLFFLYQLYDWRNDEYVVTNRRVAHIEQILISKEMREAVPIDQVVGVKVEKNGLPGLLGVTNVVIQSAGHAEGNVIFTAIADGKSVQKLIETQRAKVLARQAADEREHERGRIEDELREYILPQVVAQERAAVAASKPAPKPTRLTTRARIANLVDSWLGLEIKNASTITWRKHWLVLIQQVGKWAGGLILLDILFTTVALAPGLQFLPAGGYVGAGLVAVVICLCGIWWEWEDWRNDIYAVTETQIIDVERLPFGLNEKMNTTSLDKIQDVRVEVNGWIRLVFNFGDLKIETAGQGSQMIFHSIHDPKEAADEIFSHIESFKQRRLEKEISQRNRLYIDALIGYDRIRKEEEYHNRLRNAESEQHDADDDDDDDF